MTVVKDLPRTIVTVIVPDVKVVYIYARSLNRVSVTGASKISASMICFFLADNIF